MDRQASLIVNAVNLKVDKKPHGKFPVNGAALYQETLTLDPKLAHSMLSLRALSQRHQSQGRVERYAMDMRADRWRQTGDPIRFDRDMNLIDGQHRLAAIVDAGRSLKGQVVQVLYDDSAMLVLDQGAKRTLSDARKIGGKSFCNPCVMSAILLEHCAFTISRIGRMTIQEKISVVDAFAARGRELLHEWRGAQAKPGTGALAAAIACMRVDREKAAAFFTATFNNEPVIDGRVNKTVVTLASWIMSTRRTRGGPGSNFQMETAARCIHAWNAYRDGRTLTTSRYNPEHEMPQPQ